MDRLDLDPYDDELRIEIQLVADLMVAANESNGTLCQSDIDAVLGFRQRLDTADGSAPVDSSTAESAFPERRRASTRPDDAPSV